MSDWGLTLQFIQAAGRALWEHAWLCSPVRPDSRHSSNCSATYPYAWLICNCGVDGSRLRASAPPVPHSAHLSASILLGKLEQANGCGLAEIVLLAGKADCGIADTGEACAEHERDGCAVDVEEFARIVAIQAIGAGVGWFDSHARFDIRDPGLAPHIGPSVRSFTVPHHEFTYEEGK